MRKNGTKLRKKLLAVMKRMDKSRFRSLNEVIESPDYKKLRELKKTMESLQEECDVRS